MSSATENLKRDVFSRFVPSGKGLRLRMRCCTQFWCCCTVFPLKLPWRGLRIFEGCLLCYAFLPAYNLQLPYHRSISRKLRVPHLTFPLKENFNYREREILSYFNLWALRVFESRKLDRNKFPQKRQQLWGHRLPLHFC